MRFENCTYEIIGKAIEVHNILGPGLLESTYQKCLYYELDNAGFDVKKELSLPLIYKDLDLGKAYRIDLLVDQKIVVEIKAVEKIIPVHEAQLLTYMKLGGFKVGLIINFNTKSLIKGVKRYVM